VPHHSDETGPFRFRQLEYHRLPLMAYLALDRPDLLTRGDVIRLGLVAGPGDPHTLPFSARFLADFERTYSYDRYVYGNEGAGRSDTRFMNCGHAFVVTGDAASPFFTDGETGLLGRFRHQYFQLALIAHFHKAALLMLSDRLVAALNRMQVGEPDSVGQFRRKIRDNYEIFLRFTHRYWFHEISDQVQTRDLYRQWVEQLGTERLYRDVHEEMQGMVGYLESDNQRRQSETVLRLTVVTVMGLIGTLVTGFLGMNLFSHSDLDWTERLAIFTAVLAPTIWLVVVTMTRSRRLAEFLDALANEKLSIGKKWLAFWKVFWK
jgi:hypothetical protein